VVAGVEELEAEAEASEGGHFGGGKGGDLGVSGEWRVWGF